jgi:hypothetical protein
LSPGATGGAAGGGAAGVGGDDTGAGIPGGKGVVTVPVPGVAAGVESDAALDAAPDAVTAAAGFAGGSFNGPLMPQETSANAASVTMIEAMKRRNIRLRKLYALDALNR